MSRVRAAAVTLLLGVAPAVAGVALLVATAVPATAQTSVAQDTVAAVVDAWAADPVFVDPDAEEAIDDDAAAELRSVIRRADAGPVFVAILPGSAAQVAGGPQTLLDQLEAEFDGPGTFLLVTGANLQVTSSTLPADEVRPVVQDALTGATGAAPLLTEIVEGLGAAGGGGDAAGAAGDGNGGGVLAGLLGLAVVGGGAVAVISARRRAAERTRRFAEVRAVALEDLAGLDRAIRALELDSALVPAAQQGAAEAKADQVRALEAYAQASAGVDAARRPADFQRVSELVDDGRFAVATAQARLEGRPLPARTPPCFFDPRHGPSVREVPWAPPGGTPRSVPACAADALRVEEGGQPAAREVLVDGRPRPYYDAPGAWGPWVGGHYGYAGAGLFEGFLLGSLLSGGGGWGGGGWTGDVGGDFGGGDFGGGDFGGGDFGGGDF